MPVQFDSREKAPLNPTNFKIIADTLLLFHKTDDDDGLKLWNSGQSGENEQDLLKRADEQYMILTW